MAERLRLAVGVGRDRLRQRREGLDVGVVGILCARGGGRQEAQRAWVKDPDGNIVEISQGYTDQPDVPPAS